MRDKNNNPEKKIKKIIYEKNEYDNMTEEEKIKKRIWEKQYCNLSEEKIKKENM